MLDKKVLSIILVGLMCHGAGANVVSLSSNEIDLSDDVQQEGEHCFKVDNDPKKLVCVCNEKHCDEFVYNWPTNPGEIHLIQSSQGGLRFHVSTLSSGAQKDRPTSTEKIHVDLNDQHQTILGWGGAFTDAACINIRSLSESVRAKLLASYFGENGLQYNFGRVPIAGSDFSTRPYSYDDTDKPDANLTHWSLAKEDLDYKIPTIKEANEVVSKYASKLKLFGSPWSPPKWMKTSNDVKRGYLIDDDKIYQSYANYLVKFYQAYKEHGVEFWGATVQNEPIAAYLPFYYFNSLQMGINQTIKFVSKYLGPTLEANGFTKKNFKLMIGDDSLGFINYQVPSVMKDEGVQKYISGLAFHWYTSGSVVPYSHLTKVVDSIKDHIEFVMMSEACTGSRPGLKHVDLGSWDRGQSYASDVINDLLRGTGAWIDWNLALDQGGGPNWANNFVDSPIIVNANENEFYKQPMYYALGHFSRFFKEGSTRVGTNVESNTYFETLMATAVHVKQTGHLVVNILNKADNKKTIELNLTGTFEGIAPFTIEGKSMNTIVLKM